MHAPWSAVAVENGVTRIANPILSDLAFANIPWRAAVREAVVNGRLPLWNRFVLAGSPLLGTGQAAVLHPATWLGIFLPLALSWTFSCAFTIFLALVAGYLFFRELSRFEIAALVGAAGWGFSTYVLFFDGWAVGPSIATFPLLLLGLRRLAKAGDHGIAITTVALFLAALGGHPETLLHVVAAGGVYFLWELFARDARARAGRAIAGSLAAGVVAAALAAPALLPLLENVPHSAEYETRRSALAQGRGGQSVSALEAARRLRPAVLPFAHGIYGKSPVQEWRHDGSGVPLAYAGAALFPLAFLGAFNRSDRARWIFLAFVLLGLAYGASAPLLLDVTAQLPGFALALNYRLVFLAPFGLAGLAALGVDATVAGAPARRLATTSLLMGVVLTAAFLAAGRVFRDRSLPADFLRGSIALEVAPLVGIALVAALGKDRRRVAAASLSLVVAQRFLEMEGTYPTLPARALGPPLSVLSALADTAEPRRIVAADAVFRPNGAALYGLEDVRGYESLVLARFAQTFPLWCVPQFASFNRVDDLTRPFLSFLNARYAIGTPDAVVPAGWVPVARERDGTLFENPRALPRAFVAGGVRAEGDSGKRLAEMAVVRDFGETVWVSEAPLTPTLSRRAGRERTRVVVREIGSDLLIEADVRDRALVATSVPDWPGWRARSGSVNVPLTTVNHAFVGFWLPPGRHVVRLHYLPGSFLLGAGIFAATLIVLVALALRAVAHRRGVLR
jgi:Bacterial membrane protein YfhO